MMSISVAMPAFWAKRFRYPPTMIPPTMRFCFWVKSKRIIDCDAIRAVIELTVAGEATITVGAV